MILRTQIAELCFGSQPQELDTEVYQTTTVMHDRDRSVDIQEHFSDSQSDGLEDALVDFETTTQIREFIVREERFPNAKEIAIIRLMKQNV